MNDPVFLGKPERKMLSKENRFWTRVRRNVLFDQIENDKQGKETV